MDSKKKPQDDLTRAMTKLDHDSALLNDEKKVQKIIARKQVKAPEPPSRDEVVKKQTAEEHEVLKSEVKLSSVTIGICLFTLIMLTYTLTKTQRTTAVEYIIYTLLVGSLAVQGFFRR